jgi:hypothetical protein
LHHRYLLGADGANCCHVLSNIGLERPKKVLQSLEALDGKSEGTRWMEAGRGWGCRIGGLLGRA